MKRALLYATMFVMFACSLAYAEATFDQIQGLIKSHDYAAAVQGLNVIIQNHPRSAKAYYAMSQAQAGIGNQAKAKEALDMARGLDPSLKFAPSGSVEHLQEAIQPQTKKIEAIESHTLRNCLIAFALIGAAAFFFMRRKGRGEPEREHKPVQPHSPTPYQNAHNAASASLAMSSGNPALRARPMYTPPRSSYTPPPPVQHTTVVHNNSSSDLVTGMMLGSMMHGSHDHERTVIEREYIPVREIEAPRETPFRSSSWDDSDSKSSSWDSGSSSSSSSWDDSSSSSSSSWDSGSSDSSSSSSWD